MPQNKLFKPTQEVYIIAEIGSVHDGSFHNALRLIDIAKETGADAAKFQMHIAEAETLKEASSPPWFSNESRYDYFQRTNFTQEDWIKLKNHASKIGIDFLCSAFSIEAAEFLNRIGIKAFKIPSGEVTNHPMLEYIAKTKKPVLLPCGMSTWKELEEAYKILSKHKSQIIVMQCTSIYPCPPEKSGLNVLTEIKEKFSSILGFSDHTEGTAIAASALTLGAKVFEKHLTFSRKMYGSDAPYAREPEEFKKYILELRDTYKALNCKVDKNRAAKELAPIKKVFEKSCVAAHDLEQGKKLNLNDLAFKKPGSGISAADYKKLVGKTLKCSVKKNHIFLWKELT